MADQNSNLFTELIGWLVAIGGVIIAAISAIFKYINSKFSDRQKHVDQILERYDVRMDKHDREVENIKGQINVLSTQNLANQKEILSEIKNVNSAIQLRLEEQNKAIIQIQKQNERFSEGINEFYRDILPKKIEEEVKRQIKSAK